MTTYSRVGKQILCDGAHYADASDEASAQIIVEALVDREKQYKLAFVQMYDRLKWLHTANNDALRLITGKPVLGRNLADIATDVILAAHPTLRP